MEIKNEESKVKNENTPKQIPMFAVFKNGIVNLNEIIAIAPSGYYRGIEVITKNSSINNLTFANLSSLSGQLEGNRESNSTNGTVGIIDISSELGDFQNFQLSHTVTLLRNANGNIEMGLFNSEHIGV